MRKLSKIFMKHQTVEPKAGTPAKRYGNHQKEAVVLKNIELVGALVALSLPFFIAILYFSGNSYLGIYYNLLGSDSGLMGHSFQDVLLAGGMALLSPFMYLYKPLFLGFFGIVVIIMVVNVVREKFTSKNEVYIDDDVGNRLDTGAVTVPLWQRNLNFYLLAVLIFVAVVLSLLTITAANYSTVSFSARTEAEIKFTALNGTPWDEKSQHDVEVLEVGKSSPTKALRIVGCSINACVFLSEDGARTISTSQIVSISSTVNEDTQQK